MTPDEYIRALRRDGDRIAAAAESGPGADVPSCPGWTVADLLFHVGIVHTFWRQVAVGAVAGPDSFQEPARPQAGVLPAWFRDGLAKTAGILGQIDPITPAWTWGRRKNVGFILRRVVQETAVHCWDGVAAVGPVEPIERDVAADGVSEFLDEVLPGMSPDLGGDVQTIALYANDIGLDWTVSAGAGSCRRAAAGTRVDASVSASASDLLLLLWGRAGTDQVQIDGDISMLDRFLARASF